MEDVDLLSDNPNADIEDIETAARVIRRHDAWGRRWPPSPLFAMQVLVSLLVVAFCMVRTITLNDGCETQSYVAMIGTVLALWLPNPKP